MVHTFNWNTALIKEKYKTTHFYASLHHHKNNETSKVLLNQV